MASADRTDPALWEKVKAEVKESTQGGRKGQWSARKAQRAVQRYKEEGGGYTNKVDQSETSLYKWGLKH